MGKTKTKSRSNSKDILRGANTSLVKSSVTSESHKSTESLVEKAATHLEHSQPEQALPCIQEALRRLQADPAAYRDVDVLLQNDAQDKATFPTALVLGAAISLALGDIDTARAQYDMAVQIDPNGALVSAEPYLQLAQLCVEGGHKSIEYFDKAIEVMKNEIDVLDGQMEIEGTQEIVETQRARVADALCGMTEVYMTDLSWEEDAEQRCELLITEAVAICPDHLSAGVLQTLASIRISQEKYDQAKSALAQSLSVWKHIPLDVDAPQRPDFATRVSLVRLLMEPGIEQEDEALLVLEGLVKEDDQSVEAWYLGGWCHVLLGQKPSVPESERVTHVEHARSWLGTCLKLYKRIEYEDVKLREHADELVTQLNKDLDLPDGDDWETDDENDADQPDEDGDDMIEAADHEHEHEHDRDEDVDMT